MKPLNGKTVDTETLISQFNIWLSSEAGQEQVRASSSKTELAVKALNKARAVEAREMHEPVTV